MSGEEADVLLVEPEVSLPAGQAGLGMPGSCSTYLEGLSKHLRGLIDCPWQLVFRKPSSCHTELLKELVELHTVKFTCWKHNSVVLSMLAELRNLHQSLTLERFHHPREPHVH